MSITGAETVKPEDLILIIVGFSKEDAVKLSKGHNDYKALNNITYSYPNMEFDGALIYRVYLYSQNIYVLHLPRETMYVSRLSTLESALT